ncbi:hypothetical protein CEXT_30291 [Caerostris extrusa]|uniref:Uncharacterized protein n=1 Tax=Caerostris extrusa TaxID=172846 RepID=A0AAV4T069_CAEEX|nr:hypothetical protein CEXT_30291 [Caerostris extrusa]
MSCAHQYSTELQHQHKRRVDTDETVSSKPHIQKAPSTIIQLLKRGLSTGMPTHREEEIIFLCKRGRGGGGRENCVPVECQETIYTDLFGVFGRFGCVL